jgi:flavin-dependent dehydrogenase
MKQDSTYFRKKLKLKSLSSLTLDEGSRIAVMGGGPAGSLFAYFLIDLAQRGGLDLLVDIYEPRDFSLAGPRGCNMCAGILSESLIQMLAVDGIYVPPSVVQRGMDTYILHTQAGNARLTTTNLEKRIGTVFRGSGPLGVKDSQLSSFDGFLLEMALQKGAKLIQARVEEVNLIEGYPQVRASDGLPQRYDLLAVATGVNTNALRMFPPLETGFQQPKLVQTFIREYFVGIDQIERHMGRHTIHFFLLDIPGLDFAALVPKGDFVTGILLGKDLSQEIVEAFFKTDEVKKCMPPGWLPEEFACRCAPRINITGAIHPYADRMVFLGDSGVSRLYKDGIGAAYRAAKHAAVTAIFHGIADEDFRRHYWPACRSTENDNRVGKLIFKVVHFIKPRRFMINGMIQMVASEQTKEANQRWMSNILWDMFTGSAPYQDIMIRISNPAFWGRFIWHVGSSPLAWRPGWKQAL